MTTRFVLVPASLIHDALIKAGFSKGLEGHEEVWSRTHAKNADYVIKVYTSLTDDASSARGCGEDAIRVVALREDPYRWPARFYPIHKGARVYRTGSPEKVVERMMDRAREAYATINESIKKAHACGMESTRPSSKE